MEEFAGAVSRRGEMACMLVRAADNRGYSTATIRHDVSGDRCSVDHHLRAVRTGSRAGARGQRTDRGNATPNDNHLRRDHAIRAYWRSPPRNDHANTVLVRTAGVNVKTRRMIESARDTGIDAPFKIGKRSRSLRPSFGPSTGLTSGFPARTLLIRNRTERIHLMGRRRHSPVITTWT